MNRDVDPYRLYAIIRGDLNMSPGKISAQTGHAYLDSYLKAMEIRPETISEYKKNHGIKISMRAKRLRDLERAYEEANLLGIPCVLITDLGYYGTTENLLGKETVTALGLGPAKRKEIEMITKRFQLLE